MELRAERRERLRTARLQLLFTPRLCGERDPLEVLRAALPWIGVVQVRLEHPDEPEAPAPARDLHDWTLRVLDAVGTDPGAPLVLVNDRVDVAACLEDRGVAGVHLGADDTPPEVARRSLSEAALVGLSTHGPGDVVRTANSEALDYLGFGPIHPTATKGYTRGLGSEAAWVAASATDLPLFPIGGIEATNAGDLAEVGRAAVSSAVLTAEDPARAARELYELLGPETP